MPINPTVIHAAAQELHRKHDHIPGMPRRIDRALALALAGDVRPNGSGYVVLSARNDGTSYHLDGRGRCTCPDFHADAPQINGVTFCKHRLAFNLVLRDLVEALRLRILGNAESGNRKQAETYPNTYLLVVGQGGGRGGSALWSEQAGLVGSVTWSRSLHGWMPASHADMVRLDRWLSQADPLPLSPAETAAEVALVARWDDMLHNAEEWQPTWSTATFRRWLDTGILPAAQQLDTLPEF